MLEGFLSVTVSRNPTPTSLDTENSNQCKKIKFFISERNIINAPTKPKATALLFLISMSPFRNGKTRIENTSWRV